MTFNQARLRQLHKALVPVMLLPLLLTLSTGVLFQFAVLSGGADDLLWLLEMHRGKFGQINLELVYPFLNALGLLTLLITGFLMWLQSPNRNRKQAPSSLEK
ncbi:MAG: hypothetical protein WBA10_21070 [Elainellaceae cyanobacterium]